MSDFLKELEQRAWARDIETFNRQKTLLAKDLSDTTRTFVLKRMQDIQARWPQFIKLTEIPT